jgi:hypothetical protein
MLHRNLSEEGLVSVILSLSHVHMSIRRRGDDVLQAIRAIQATVTVGRLRDRVRSQGAIFG